MQRYRLVQLGGICRKIGGKFTVLVFVKTVSLVYSYMPSIYEMSCESFIHAGLENSR